MLPQKNIDSAVVQRDGCLPESKMYLVMIDKENEP